MLVDRARSHAWRHTKQMERQQTGAIILHVGYYDDRSGMHRQAD